MILVTIGSFAFLPVTDFGLSLNIIWDTTINSISSFGFVVQFLAPVLLIVIVAVIFMSKPEEITLRRWHYEY